MSKTTYTPDRWVIVRIQSIENGCVDKILCSWSGSYRYGASWKLSSGIITFDERDGNDLYMSKQDSGSIYILRKTSEQMSGIMSSVYNTMQENFHGTENSIEIIQADGYRIK